MQNLAGNKDCDVPVEKELMRAGIDLLRGMPRDNEVPASIRGQLGKFTFTRAWYYWVVKGDVPIEVARELYEDPVGKTDVRVAGHCMCPAPDKWTVWKTPDGCRVLAAKEEEGFKASALKYLGDDSEDSLLKLYGEKYVFSDDPESLGAKQCVGSYHIDSELGLYKFVEALKRHHLV